MITNFHCKYELPTHLRMSNSEAVDLYCTEIPESDDGFCIFHNPSLEKDCAAFTNGIQSKRNSNYRGYVFPLGFHTELLQLSKADFRGACFKDRANFSGQSFTGSTCFSGVTFERSASFAGARFSGDVEFENGTFRSVSFAEGIFGGRASFRNARFLELDLSTANLDETYHAGYGGGAVDFHDAKFEGFTDFRDSVFGAKSSFASASFVEAVDFRRTEFCKNAATDFFNTIFSQKCSFVELQTHSKITFTECLFKEDADFRNAALYGPTTLERVTFGRLARFGGLPPQDTELALLNVRFWEVDMALVAFRNADLRNVCFYHCKNLDSSEFSACIWNQSFGRQHVLYDELMLRGSRPEWGSEELAQDSEVERERNQTRNDERWEKVENTYRDLRRNFEDRRDFADASEFYVGEMEVRRLAKPRHEREVLSLEALYFHLSTYGENWWKPLVWLFVLLLLSTSVYTGWGLRVDNPGAVSENIIRIFWQPGVASPTNDLKMFVWALLHSLSVLSFLRISVAEPLHWTGQFMAIMQLLLSPILITLSLLAIRRKLKR
ncbi:MAG: pentapeptide repeat-containing protein [Chloroflexi bacterium]|nr:pentapeptide repeat-containing protein [Chloroflexota bacterium]